MSTTQHGHYFEFKRGEWVKDGNKPAQHFSASGVTYVGYLTRKQRDELDALIEGYLKSINTDGVMVVNGTQQENTK